MYAIITCLRNYYAPNVVKKKPDTISLRNGEKVSKSVLKATLLILECLEKKDYKLCLKLDLSNKAYDSSYVICGTFATSTSENELKELGLIDQNSEMDKEVAAIIRNCFITSAFHVESISPIKGKNLQACKWEQLSQSL